MITVLKNKGVGAKKIPTTGQDATLQGMENILQGYQCGSVYKAIYQEAQDAVALATILRAGKTPPTALVNSTTTPPKGVTGTAQPASLLTPVWVNAANMNVHGDHGQVHLGLDAVHRRGQRASAPPPTSLRNLQGPDVRCETVAASCGGGLASGRTMAYSG